MNERPIIHIVNDNFETTNLLSFILTEKGYTVNISESSFSTLETIKQSHCALLILNLNANDEMSTDLCSSIKSDENTKNIPIIFISKRSEEASIINALEQGADDYLIRPISAGILLAKIKCLLRKRVEHKQVCAETHFDLTYGPFQLDTKSYQVRIDKRPISLTLQEYKLLYYFMSHPSWVLSREQIIRSVHGEDYFASDRVIDVQISHLRKKISPYGRFIKTIRGAGYLFEEESTQTELSFTQ